MKKQLFLGKKPQRELLTPIKNRDSVKAYGGLWTSTLDEDGESDWIKWCKNEDFYTTKNLEKWILTVNKDARVLKIDSYNDLEKAFERYGYVVHHFYFLDYEKMAKDYDGMWLTMKG